MSAFRQYQADFTGHIRDPESVSRPKGVPARRMKIYTEIVFNNMEATLAACFPVTKKIVGIRRWRQLVRAFLAGHACTTPWFRQIPEEFLRWLEDAPERLLPFIRHLAHYEWIELAVAVADIEPEQADADGDLLEARPVLAAALALLEYPYPVHHISPHFKPMQPDDEPTRLLVFRDAGDEVHFVEINGVTARLVQLLQEGLATGRAALERIAAELQHPDPSAVMNFGAVLLEDLRQQGAILGTSV
jgi:hypothetical protein